MFRTFVHVTMPFCACGDEAKLVTGVCTYGDRFFHYVECSRCTHKEQSRVEKTEVTVVLVSGGPPKPPNFRD